ncbi:PTS sugar transporter subunit IIA [Microbacteriaceae bacterium 4G12]
MFKTLIVGHGKYPSGVLSALKLLMGENENVSIIELNEQLTHDQYEIKITEFLKENDKVVIFADLTGGAPHQIAARIILEKQFSKEHFVISGMPLSLITDLTMKFQFLNVEAEEIPATIESSINECKELMQCISLEMV